MKIRRRVTSCLLAVVLLVGGITVRPTEVNAAGGTGTQQDPYLVTTCQEVYDIREDLDAYYLLQNDIDCSGLSDFMPIGYPGNAFTGQLDGAYHTISNLIIDQPNGDEDYVGLFGQVGDFNNQQGLIKDLALEDIDVTGDWTVGGLVGLLYGQVNNSHTTGTVHGRGEVGGLVGSHGGTWDTVIDSWSSVDVTSTDDVVGGLVGYNAYDSNIVNSYATGAVNGGSNYVGGLVGYNDGSITNTNAEGAVDGTDYTGGLVGRNGGTVTHSFATGHVSSDGEYVGGFVGINMGMINTSYSHNDAGNDNVGVIGGCYIGGFAGHNTAQPSGEIQNSYTRSTSSSGELVCSTGGFIGENVGNITFTYSTGRASSGLDAYGGFAGITDNNISLSFWDTETSTLNDACGEPSDYDCEGAYAIMPRASASMKTLANYTTELSEGTWDFNDIWTFIPGTNDDYPVLQDVGSNLESWPTQPEQNDDQDLNGDTVPDSEQPNIGGYTNSLTGRTVAIDVGEDCELTTDDMVRESQLATQDAAFEYPNGLWDFEADCGTPGFTTTITLYYYGVAPTNKLLRKFHPGTNAFATIADAAISSHVISGHTVTTVTYQVTDGGQRDTDGQINGMITDPAGLAVQIVDAPNTGF